MTWFKVDDGFHSHPKALAASLPALGLWTVAGSWSGANLTDGFIPEHVVALLARGNAGLAEELVAAGLWRKTQNGYRFHAWKKRNPTKKEVEKLRKTRAEAGRRGGLNTRKAGLTSPNTESKPEANAQANAKQNAKQNRSTRGSTPVPSRPDLYVGGGENLQPAPYNTPPPPPSRCPTHNDTDGPIPPCRACADARRALYAWQTQHPLPNPDLERQNAFLAQTQRNRRRRNGQACPHCDDTGWTTTNPTGDAELCNCATAPHAP